MNDYYITIDHYITICQTSLTSNISKKVKGLYIRHSINESALKRDTMTMDKFFKKIKIRSMCKLSSFSMRFLYSVKPGPCLARSESHNYLNPPSRAGFYRTNGFVTGRAPSLSTLVFQCKNQVSKK